MELPRKPSRMGVLDGVAPTHRDRPTDQASGIESVNTSAFTVTNGQMTSGLLFIRKEPSGVTSKAANGDHFKTGQRMEPGLDSFSPVSLSQASLFLCASSVART